MNFVIEIKDEDLSRVLEAFPVEESAVSMRSATVEEMTRHLYEYIISKVYDHEKGLAIREATEKVIRVEPANKAFSITEVEIGR